MVDADARGAGIRQALVSAAHDDLAQHGVQVMNISVLAGNDAALRFYERDGATAFVQTVVMPTSGRQAGFTRRGLLVDPVGSSTSRVAALLMGTLLTWP